MVEVMILSQISPLSVSVNFLLQSLTQMSAIAQIGTFFLAWLVVWLPIAIPLLIRFKWQPFEPFTPAQKLPLLMSLYPIAPLLLGGVAVGNQQTFEPYGFRGQPDFFLAILGGIGMSLVGLALLFGIAFQQGWLQWQSAASVVFWQSMPLSFLIGAWVSVTEELVFRGFLLNQLVSVWPFWGGAIATSLIFALLHLVWERQETLPQLPGLWLMGMVLVLARWANQGGLGLAIGLHAGWVGGMICLDSSQVWLYRDRAPAWFVGVAQKPLAGAGGLLLLLLTGGVIWAIAPLL